MAIKLVRNVIWENLPKKLMNEMTSNNINAVYVSENLSQFYY